MVLRDTIDVRASPADVFAFFDGMDNARYLGWHPDHKVFRWTRGKGLKVGNQFYFEEVIAGKLLKKNVAFTRIEEGTHIEFAPTFWLMRLFLPRLVFRLEALAAGQYRFIAEIFLRAGPLAARLNKREFDAVREHMRIEGINLKRFVENLREHVTVQAVEATRSGMGRSGSRSSSSPPRPMPLRAPHLER